MIGVEMRAIVKTYGEATALNGVDLDLHPGEIHAILGENGAGKSTLMHILSGSTRPDRGEIRVDGRSVRVGSPRAARRLGIAMVHQHFTLVPALTVSENLALDTESRSLAAALNYSSRRESAAAMARARSLGWTIDPDARAGDLPVGAQQRVEIVKALATGARTLIFDEPTAVLAGIEVDDLFAVLRTLRDERRSVVLITHKLAEILAVADQVTVFRNGERVATAPVADTNARKLAEWMMGAQSIEGAEPPAHAAVGHAGRPSTAQRPQTVGSTETEAQSQRQQTVAFTANGIHVRGDRREQSVRGVTFEIRRGEIFGIGGVDGNGQAELAEALVGLRPLLSGEMLWLGGECRPGVRPSTGYIPQDRRRAGLAVTMTVEENLILNAVQEPAFRFGPFLRRRALSSIASALVRQFDIRMPGLDHHVSTLSGGNQQKIVVARALRSNPDWIVAVNPTRGLDIGSARFVREQLVLSRNRGAAIVLISTDLDELAALSTRAAILSAGVLTETRLEGSRIEDIGLMMGGLPASQPQVINYYEPDS